MPNELRFVIALLSLLTWGDIHWVRAASLPVGERARAGMPERPEEPKQDRGFLLTDLEELDRKIEGRCGRKENLDKRLEEIERECLRMRSRLESMNRGAERLRRDAGARLLALYKFKQMGYATPLAFAVGSCSAATAAELAGKLARHDDRVFSNLLRENSGIENLENALIRKEAESKAIKAWLDSNERILLSEQERRNEVLARVLSEEDLFAQYMARLNENQNPGTRALTRKPLFDSHEKPFFALQGNLPLPVVGEVVHTFGPKGRKSSFSALHENGVLIVAPRGRDVCAVRGGIVAFAAWFREYGNVMIIDHGDHCHTLIAHLDTLLRQAGDIVRKGDTIASVGSTGSLKMPALYFEIRHHGIPVDPMEWLDLHKSMRE
jgi:septal ring factor EnvC (AmiA/AmiB activator)